MTKVIKVRFGKLPKYSGTARCLACKHEWEAESDDYSWLDCPKCGTMRGMWDKLWTLPQDTQLWVCGCDCDQFMITNIGMFCVGCGCVASHAAVTAAWET